MNRAIHSWLLASILALLPHTASAQAKFALVIGVKGYEHFDVTRKLRYADSDAVAFAQFLTSPQGGFPPSHVFLLTDSSATHDAIQAKIAELKAQVRRTSTSLLYVFFAGHALPDVDSYVYLEPYDGDPDHPELKGFRLDEFHTHLHEIGATYMIFFADACYSGAVLNSGRLGPIQQADESASRGGSIVGAAMMRVWAHAYEHEDSQEGSFLSSTAVQESFEDSALHHGLFTYYLVRGLRGAADSTSTATTDGVITMDELRVFVRDSVEARSVSRFGRRQSPVPPVAMSSTFPLAYYFFTRRDALPARPAARPLGENLLDIAALARTHFNDGYRFGQQKKYREAADAYLAALRLDPKYAVAQNNYGVMMERLGDSAEAIRSYRAAIRLDSTFALAHRNWALHLSRNGDTARAVAELRRALALDPQTDHAHTDLGVLLQVHGDFAAARAQFDSATRQDTSDAIAWVNYGHNVNVAGETDLGIRYLRRGIDRMRKSPDDYAATLRAWGMHRLGDALVAAHNRPAAATWYQAASKTDTSDSYATARLRISDSTLKLLTDSATALEQRLSSNPDDTAAYGAATIVFHEELLQPQRSLPLTERWLARHPSYSSAKYDLAENYFTAGQYAKADSAISQALSSLRTPVSTKIALSAVGLANDLAMGRKDRIASRFGNMTSLLAQQPDTFKVNWVFFGTRSAVRNASALEPYREQLGMVYSALGASPKARILERLETARIALMYPKS